MAGGALWANRNKGESVDADEGYYPLHWHKPQYETREQAQAREAEREEWFDMCEQAQPFEADTEDWFDTHENDSLANEGVMTVYDEAHRGTPRPIPLFGDYEPVTRGQVPTDLDGRGIDFNSKHDWCLNKSEQFRREERNLGTGAWHSCMGLDC